MRSVIDYKFDTRTSIFFTIQIAVYLMFFILPYSIQLLWGLEGAPAQVCLIIAMVGQLFFYFNELISIKVEGLSSYLSDPWNYLDQS